ncbi:hypothetical protein OG21DRAFT_1480156 [Imleria badia]|nr:hypothetical protein OG21DRAFT_1480156 [Imleria badia]
MTASTVPTTAASSSGSPSALSSTAPIPITSASFASMPSSTPSSTIVTSSNNNGSTTSTPESSVQPTTPSATTTSKTIQSSTLISSSLDTTMTSSSSPISASTSNTPFTTASSSLPSNSSSQSSSPGGGTDIPLTTVLESTTIFITSTNSQGHVMTSIPPVVTEVITTTGSGGIVTTVTQAIVNPTLASNNSTTGNSSFFTNTGAVVGVFVVVGLASASIMMWILFAIRHRQRMRQIEQDSAVEAVVAAAGLNRAPLDDGDEDDSPISPNTHTRHQFSSGMGHGFGGSGSLPTSARLSEVLDDTIKNSANSHPGCSIEHHVNSHPEGYVPARTTSPSPQAERCTDELGSSRDRKSSYGHTPTYSAGSFEPLLANYAQNMPDQDTSTLAMRPPRNRSPQHPGGGLALNGYFSDGSPEDGSRSSSKRQNSSHSSVLRDDEDDTRYVLMASVCHSPM